MMNKMNSHEGLIKRSGTMRLYGLQVLLLMFFVLSSNVIAAENRNTVQSGALVFISETLAATLKSDIWRQRIEQPLFKDGRRTNYNSQNIVEIDTPTPVQILEEVPFKMKDAYLSPENEPGPSYMNLYSEGYDLVACRVQILEGIHEGITGWVFGELIKKSVNQISQYIITFTDGRSIFTQAYEEDDNKIFVEQYGGIVGYSKDTIKTIKKD
ncbi:MAG: hypothetical protein KKE17_14305 [Proteobacteria bacterium]|nr:hypothetical protein [Pseudomonadota bacterium]MBU1711173.1 hypothetical protein [Pseudomonadota bacterium]